MRYLMIISLLFAVHQATAQVATSSSHALESAALTGGGNFGSSASHQMWSSVGQGTSLAVNVTLVGTGGQVQPGAIPTLYPRTLLGDANDDGVVDAADVVTAVEIASGNKPQPTRVIHFYNTDANTDLRLTLADIGAIVDILVGL